VLAALGVLGARGAAAPRAAHVDPLYTHLVCLLANIYLYKNALIQLRLLYGVMDDNRPNVASEITG
jgi:hypothetical protein